MISITISGKKYSVKNQWSDLTVKDLHGIKSIKPIDLVHSLSNIPPSLLEQLPESNLLALYQIVSFVEDAPTDIRVKHEVNVANESWKKLELTRSALKIASPPFVAVEVAGIYFGDKIFNWPISLVYGQTYQILESLNVFLERYKDLGDSDPYDEDQLEAGVQGLESFGVGAIRYSLAKGDVTKYAAIESMSAEDVYFTLLYEKGVNEYQKRLKNIYDRQNGISSRANSNGNKKHG